MDQLSVGLLVSHYGITGKDSHLLGDRPLLDFMMTKFRDVGHYLVHVEAFYLLGAKPWPEPVLAK